MGWKGSVKIKFQLLFFDHEILFSQFGFSNLTTTNSHPAPLYSLSYSCFLKVSGPLKGRAEDRVQGTLGLYSYMVILALPGCLTEGSLREGDGNLANEGRMGILQCQYGVKVGRP